MVVVGGGGGSRYQANMPANFNDFRDLGNVGNYSPQMQKVADWFLVNVEPLFATEAKAITTVLIVMGILIGIALIFGLYRRTGAPTLRKPRSCAWLTRTSKTGQK